MAEPTDNGQPTDAKTEAANIATRQDEGVTTAAADAYNADAAANTPERQQYWQDVATNLEQSGDLPTMDILNKEGFSSARTAESQKGYIAAGIDNPSLNPIDKATLRQLNRDFDYLDAASEGDGINQQSFENLDKFKADKQAQQSDVAVLTGGGGGKPEETLLGRVDEDADGDGGDYKVNRDDIKEALENRGQNYSEDERKFLEGLANQSDEDWEKNPLVKDGTLNKQSLVDANNFGGLGEKELGGKTGDEAFDALTQTNKFGAHFDEGNPDRPSYVMSSDGTRRDFQYGPDNQVVGLTEYKNGEATARFGMNEQGQWGKYDENNNIVPDGTSGHRVDKDGNYQVFQDLSGDPAMEGKPPEEAHVLRRYDATTGQEQVITGVQPWTPPKPAEGEQPQ